jgi:hypothetical protein
VHSGGVTLAIMCMLVSVLLIIGRDRFVRDALRAQKAFFNFFGLSYGEREVKRGKVLALIVGIGFIANGVYWFYLAVTLY